MVFGRLGLCRGDVAIDVGPGELVLASAIPGSSDSLGAWKRRLGTASAVRRERKVWQPPAAGKKDSALETDKKLPIGLKAAALALAGPNASVNEVQDVFAESESRSWDIRTLRGSSWRVSQTASSGKMSEEKGKEGNFRASQLFEAASSQDGTVSAAQVVTVFRKVKPDDSPTGGYFKIGLGEIDKERGYIIQGIQTVTLYPPPPFPGGTRTDLPLAKYKTRLLLSPITSAE